jgi:hypothetical protein
MRADIDRQRVRVSAFATREHGAHLVDAHGQAGSIAPAFEQLPALIIVGQRLAIIAAGYAGADLRHLHQRIPQTVAVNPEIFAWRCLTVPPQCSEFRKVKPIPIPAL